MGATAGIVMGAGAALKAYGTYQSGKADAQAAEFNRELSLENAQIAREQTQAELVSLRRRQYRELGTIRAATGASGIVMDGSALDVLEFSVAEATLDAQRLKYQGELRARGYMNDAELYGREADAAMTRARYGAASELLMGASNMADYYAGTPVQVAGGSVYDDGPGGYD